MKHKISCLNTRMQHDMSHVTLARKSSCATHLMKILFSSTLSVGVIKKHDIIELKKIINNNFIILFANK